MADIKISEMTTAATLNGTEVSVLSQSQGGQLVSVKATLQAIANWFAVNAEYTNALNTQDKRICGAINELKQLISLIPQFSIEVVQVLPTEDISDTTIYLVPAEDPEVGNYYEEYIHVNDSWELVGTTAVDLSDYYTKAQADGKFAVTISNTISPTTTTKKVADIKQNNVTTPVYADDADAILRAAFGEHTASGNPVSVDAFLGLEVASECKVTMNPIQDLHGYDSPWVGGAGKNKLPLTVANLKSLNTSGTWSGNAYTFNDVVFTVLTDESGDVTGINMNGTASADTSFKLSDEYTASFEGVLNSQGISGSSTTYELSAGVNNTTRHIYTDDYTIQSGASVSYIQYVARSGFNAQNIKLYPMLRLSTVTDATFAPYSNICPISGRDSVTVTRTGVNLFGGQAMIDNALALRGSASRPLIDDTANTIEINSAQESAKNILSFADLNLSQKSYSFFYCIQKNSGSTNRASNLQLVYTDGTADNIPGMTTRTGTYDTPETLVFVTNANKTPAFIRGYNQAGTTTLFADGSGLLEGSLALADFEPYTIETHTHTYASPVYGGTDDFVSGEGSSDRVLVEYDGSSDEGWAQNGSSGVYITVPTEYRVRGKAYMMNKYQVLPTAGEASSMSSGQSRWNTNYTAVQIKDENGMTVSAFRQLLQANPLQILYYTDTPTALTNTPEEISLLKGVNVLSTDGDSLEVKYSADIKAYIDSKLA